jgi:hypothetical protein
MYCFTIDEIYESKTKSLILIEHLNGLLTNMKKGFDYIMTCIQISVDKTYTTSKAK